MLLKDILPLLDEDDLLTIFDNGVIVYAKDVKSLKSKKFLNREVEAIYISEYIDGLCIALKKLTHQHEDKGE